jgi:tetratricopeptide (TPR) repeat protein
LQKWGLIRPVHRTHAETYYGFPDLGVVKQAEAELADGARFRAVLKNLLSARLGQLTFDFRLDAPRAKVLELKRREPPPLAALMSPSVQPEPSSAEHLFVEASMLDTGDPENINLANLHYAGDQIAEAQALYERAIGIEPDVFEAHFNLGNIFHDLGRYLEAQTCYREALALNPAYADAHFYLAVTLEKVGQSHDARPHWRAYQLLAPNGEWVELAKEFSD